MAEERPGVVIGPLLGLPTDSVSGLSDQSNLIFAKIAALGEKHRLRENPTPAQKRRAAVAAWAGGYALLLRNFKFKKESDRVHALQTQLSELERTLKKLSADE